MLVFLWQQILSLLENIYVSPLDPLQLTRLWQLESICSRKSPVLADQPTKAAKLHRLLTSLAPMQSGNIFEVRLADDTSSIRDVGFDMIDYVHIQFPYFCSFLLGSRVSRTH